MTAKHATAYERVTEQIIAALEAGIASGDDYRLPWHRDAGSSAMPRNVAGHQYSGVNVVSLWASGMLSNYASPVWATYKQWAAIGAQVRGGEKGSPILYFGTYTKEVATPNGDKEERHAIAAKSYTVFNSEQVEGWTPPAVATIERTPLEKVADLEAIVAATGATIAEGGQRAYYQPSTDQIRMPDDWRFNRDGTRVADWYAVLFHELGHWTGHKSRFARFDDGASSRAEYALEELVADLASAFCCAATGIASEPRPDHARYLAGWLAAAKADPKALVKSASAASKAARYILEPEARAELIGRAPTQPAAIAA